MTDIDQIELDLWTKELEKAEEGVKSAEEYVKSDPIRVIIDCQTKFKDLLDNNKGEARHNKAFTRKVSELDEKERQARNRSKSFDLIKALDAQNKAKIYLNQIEEKLGHISYRLNLKKERKV